jgi:2-polyprenyl-3-methyl-5-hydroxy-6-metoxy-1,4-benzoquinol methylase
MHAISRIDPCPLCGATSAKVVYRFPAGNYVRCTQCNLLSVDPIPDSTHVDDRATLWANLHHQSQEKVEQHYSEAFQKIAFGDMLNSLAPFRQTGKILDVGCGIGGFISAAKRNGWEEVGIDISPSLEIARKAGLTVLNARIEEVDFPPASFDVITMIDVIEHINHLDTLMENVCRLLRPGGAFLVVTPNLASLNSRILGKRWVAVEPEDHLVLFTPRTLTDLLARNRFSVVRMDTKDANPLEFLSAFSKRDNLQYRITGQKKNRRLIGALMRRRSLQSIRGGVNSLLNVTHLGERLIALAALSQTG